MAAGAPSSRSVAARDSEVCSIDVSRSAKVPSNRQIVGSGCKVCAAIGNLKSACLPAFRAGRDRTL